MLTKFAASTGTCKVFGRKKLETIQVPIAVALVEDFFSKNNWLTSGLRID
jgi:hypothetical protein